MQEKSYAFINLPKDYVTTISNILKIFRLPLTATNKI